MLIMSTNPQIQVLQVLVGVLRIVQVDDRHSKCMQGKHRRALLRFQLAAPIHITCRVPHTKLSPNSIWRCPGTLIRNVTPDRCKGPQSNGDVSCNRPNVPRG